MIRAWLAFALVLSLPALAHAQTAADEYYDPAEMEAARRALREDAGGQTNFFIQGDRLEFRSNNGDPLFLWDAQGWIGGDINKFWVKTEGEYEFDTDSKEIITVLAGAMSVFFPEYEEWEDFDAGATFVIQAKSKFKVSKVAFRHSPGEGP